MQLSDLIDLIIDSDLKADEKTYLARNLTNLQLKFREKFGHDVDI